jgi:hypothetical protein
MKPHGNARNDNRHGDGDRQSLGGGGPQLKIIIKGFGYLVYLSYIPHMYKGIK